MSPKRYQTASGFTFIEVMVALAIMATALVTVIIAQSQSMVLVEKARDVSAVAELARGKMDELEMRFRDKGFGEIPEKEEGVFEGEQWEGFRWAYTVKKIELPMGNDAQAATSGKAQGPVGMGVIADAIGNSIRIMTLTLSWGTEKNPQSLELISFLTSSKSLPQFNIPGGAPAGGSGSAPAPATGGAGGDNG